MRIIILLILLSFTGLSAQQKDFGIWTSVSFEKKLTKRHALSAFTQWSFNQNCTKLQSAFIDLGWTYRINPNFSFSLHYRFIELRMPPNYNELQRFYVDFSYGKSIKKFYLLFRTRYQIQFYGMNLVDSYKNPKNMIRNRFTARYNITRMYSPYVFIEQFFRLDGHFQTEAIRAGLGMSFRLNQKHTFDVFFLNQSQMNVKRPKFDFILGFTYNIKI